MPKVLHIITGLNVGGAEAVLLKLRGPLRERGFDDEVISLTDVGPLGEAIAQTGAAPRGLGLGPRSPFRTSTGLPRLMAWIRAAAPDVIQTWMYNADLIGGIAARASSRAPVVWNIRQTELVKGSSATAGLSRRLCAALSRVIPEQIVCNSEAGRRLHVALGYAPERLLVIPNGFDLDAYAPDPAARREVRRELGLPDDAPVVGLVARFDPHKDLPTFIEAARHLHAARQDVRFVLCGHALDDTNRTLARWIASLGGGASFLLLGRRHDMPRLLRAFDLLALSSTSEGFPNVVGEAMASEVPCVVTDVGDAALIVGDTGRVVPPGDARALAHACAALLALPAEARGRLGRAARERVGARYGLAAMADQYARLYTQLLGVTRR